MKIASSVISSAIVNLCRVGYQMSGPDVVCRSGQVDCGIRFDVNRHGELAVVNWFRWSEPGQQTSPPDYENCHMVTFMEIQDLVDASELAKRADNVARTWAYRLPTLDEAIMFYRSGQLREQGFLSTPSFRLLVGIADQAPTWTFAPEALPPEQC